MQIITGKHRIVFVVGPLVLKVARVSLEPLLKGPRIRMFIIKALFGGLMENVREVFCYFTTRHRVLVPVWLPLFVVNIYPKVGDVGVLGRWDKVLEGLEPLILQDEIERPEYKGILNMFRDCGHSFVTRNFSFSNGQVRFVDYGQKGLREIIMFYGDRLEEHLLAVARELS